MKKSILVFCAFIASLGLMAFGIITWKAPVTSQNKISCNQSMAAIHPFDLITEITDAPDLVYKVESRFLTTISKENLLKAKTIVDILPKKATESATSFHDVEVAILGEGQNKKKFGENEVLNMDQTKLLQSVDYSSNIFVKADYKLKNTNMGCSANRYLTYYISITPENEAEYIGGQDALIDYLREKSKEEVALIKKEKLRPGRVNFTVTKEGTLANVRLDSTCGYPSVDEALIGLVTDMSGKWNPASNSKGEKVDQELVFFFGLEGC